MRLFLVLVGVVLMAAVVADHEDGDMDDHEDEEGHHCVWGAIQDLKITGLGFFIFNKNKFYICRQSGLGLAGTNLF